MGVRDPAGQDLVRDGRRRPSDCQGSDAPGRGENRDTHQAGDARRNGLSEEHMKENAEKFRALDTAELDKQLREGAEQMFRLRFQLSMGQMDGVKKLRVLRKERARILTVLQQKGVAPSAAAAAPVPLVTKTK